MSKKWQSLDNDDDEDELSLPQPKEISRLALADPAFDAQQFLVDHAAYRSLTEVQSIVGQWETKLYDELMATVNLDFDEFLLAVDSVQSGESSLEQVYKDIRRFEAFAQAESANLAQSRAALDKELVANRDLALREAQAQKLMYMYTLLSELEAAVPETSSADRAQLVVLCKLYVAMSQIAAEFRDVKAVNVLRISFDSVKGELLRKVTEAEPDLELLKAREFLKSL